MSLVLTCRVVDNDPRRSLLKHEYRTVVGILDDPTDLMHGLQIVVYRPDLRSRWSQLDLGAEGKRDEHEPSHAG